MKTLYLVFVIYTGFIVNDLVLSVKNLVFVIYTGFVDIQYRYSICSYDIMPADLLISSSSIFLTWAEETNQNLHLK